jgi:hypothetical protein
MVDGSFSIHLKMTLYLRMWMPKYGPIVTNLGPASAQSAESPRYNDGYVLEFW